MCETLSADVVINAMAEGVVEVDLDGNVVRVNPAAEKIVGYERSDFETMNYMRPTDLEIYDRYENPIGPEGLAVARVLGTGEPVHKLIVGLKRGDKMTWISVNGEPLFNQETGELAGAIAVFQDITEEKNLADEKDKALQTHLQIANLVKQAIEQQAIITIRETGLTRREVEILQLIGKGQSNHQIAARLGIVEARVRSLVTSIKKKVGAQDRVQIALYAIDSGIVNSDIV